MLRKTKNFLKAHGVAYEKEHVNPLMVPEKNYVLKFEKNDKTESDLLRYLKKHAHRYAADVKKQHHKKKH